MKGWLDKYQGGGKVDNKPKRLVNLRDATITSEDLEYLNSASGYCPKGNCLENTRKGYDMTAGRLPGVPTTGNIWSNDLKAFSTSSSPTQEQIIKYPYLMGDKSSGSADSWDIQGLVVSSGGKNMYSGQPNQVIPNDVPMGAIYGWGPAGTSKSKRKYASYNEKFGLQPSHHSTQSVGWNEKGEPMLYDGHFGKYGTFNEISKLLKDRLGYELENIGVPKSIASNTKENLSKKGILKTELTPYNVDVNKLIEATKQPWAKIKEDGKLRTAKADKAQLSEFAKSLSDNKGLLVSNLGISNAEYDKLADTALAIAMTESEGGGALDAFDMFGSTQGMTQLNAENIMKDDRLKSARNKKYTKNATIGGNNSIRNPHNSAIATMMYLSVADKDAKRLFDKGLKSGVRSFNEPGLISQFRDTNSRLNKDGVFIDELNKRIPYSEIPGYKDENVSQVNNYLKKLTKSDKYTFVNKDGDLTLKMKTKGNNPKLTDVEKIGYMWQSPNALATGDAEGKSEYVNKIKNYYESLRKRKDGGWLEKYNDGGPVQENYNDYSVSAPEGYVGDGTFNEGRDYSPAWGGQFQMGGSLPGAVGFTYARTQSPAPSNGKYAKKTIASAQDGISFPGKWTGDLKDIWTGNKSARDFNLEYTQSPNFKKLLKKQGYTDAEIKQRHQAIVDLNESRTSYNSPDYNNVNPDEQGIERLHYNPQGLGDWSNWGDIAAHEWGHVGVTGDRSGPTSLKPAEQKLLTDRLNWENVSGNPNARAHDIAPQENRADLVELRKALQDRKIYDSFKGGEFKQEHLDKLHQKDPEYWNRSMRLYKDKDIIKLMNTIAANNPEQGMPMAQNGMEMRYYQNGLDFEPKGMGKNGKVIKDDMGQWAHPGEITEIGSNQITMQGVPYPVLGVSDTGDMQMMYPDQEYEYDGESVTEYPMMKEGGALQLTKLDQLTNFTNYNTKQPGGWLDKYQ